MRTRPQPRVIPGKVLHVVSNNVLHVDFDLAFGVGITRNITIEGVRPVPGVENDPMHCMVVLLGGGRNIFVLTDDVGQGIGTLSRVYLDTVLRGSPPEGVMFRPAGHNEKCLEVGAYYSWLQDQTPKYNVQHVRNLLNGTRKEVRR